MESPVHVREEGSPSREDVGGDCEEPFSATLDLVGQLTVTDADSVGVLDNDATANLVGFSWLERHFSIMALPVLRPILRGRDSN